MLNTRLVKAILFGTCDQISVEDIEEANKIGLDSWPEIPAIILKTLQNPKISHSS